MNHDDPQRPDDASVPDFPTERRAGPERAGQDGDGSERAGQDGDGSERAGPERDEPARDTAPPDPRDDATRGPAAAGAPVADTVVSGAEPAPTRPAAQAPPTRRARAESRADRPRRRGRIRRWLFRGAIALLVLIVAVRVALPFVLPSIVDSAVAGMGLTARYEKLDLSLSTLDIELWHAVLAPAEAVEDDGRIPVESRYVDLEYARIDVDVLALFTGEIRVRRAEIDGLDVRLRRTADGRFDIERHFPPADEEASEPEAEAEPDDGPEPEAALDLTIPVIVDAMRAQHVRLELVDETVDPPARNIVDVDVRLSGLGYADAPALLQVSATGGELVELAEFDGSFESGPRRLDARFAGKLVGLHPAAAATWLEPLGIEAVAHSIDARFRAVAALEPAPSSELAARGEVRIEAVELRADGVEQAGLDGVTVRIEDLTTRRIQLPAVAIRGIRAGAETLEDGSLLVAGLRIRPAPTAAAQTPIDATQPDPTQPDETPPDADEPAPEAPVAGAEPPAGAAAPFDWSLDRFRIGDVRLTFVDRSTGRPARLAFELTEFLVENVDPDRPDADTTIGVRAALPGLAETMTLAGTARPFATRRTAELRLDVGGITLAEARPYLLAAGLEPEFEDGSFAASVEAAVGTDTDGALRADAAIGGIRLASGDAEHFALDRVGVAGVLVAADGRRIGVDSVEIRGLRSAAAIDAEGVLHVLGLRTVPAADMPAAPAVETADGGSNVRPRRAGPPPRIEVGEVRMRDTRLRFLDASRPTPVEIAPTRVELDLEDLALGGDPAEYDAARADFRFTLAEDDSRNQLAIAGKVATRPGPLHLDADLQLTGDRLTLDTVAPYLADAGLASGLRDGALTGALTAAVRDRDGTLHVTAEVRDVAFTDGDDIELLGLTRLALDELQAGADGVRITGLTVTGPRVAARRDADGAIHAMGVVIAAPADGDPEATPPAVTEGGAEGAADAGGPAAEVPGAEPTDSPDGNAGGFRLDRVALEGCRVAWSDAALETPVTVALELAASIEDLAPGTPTRTRLGLQMAVAGALDELRVEGTARLDAAETGVDLRVRGRGLRAGPLAVYLPPTVEVGLEDGRLALGLVARRRPADGGGDELEVALRDLDYRDGEAGEPLLALDEIALRAPRVDLDGGQVLVEEVALRGLALGARRTGPQRVELLGIAIDASRAEPAVEEPATADAAPAAVEPLAAAAAATEQPAPLPTIRVERIDIGLESFTFVDETAAGSTPLTASLRLTNPEPWRILEAEPDQLPPLRLSLAGAATPLVAAVDVDLAVAPFADDPHAECTIDIRGIRGAGITEVLPELAAQLDGGGLTDGRFQAKLATDLRIRRRSPTDFDLSQGFGAVATLSDIAFRAEPEGPVLAGIGEIFADVQRIDRRGGVRVATLEISDLVGRVERDAAGLHALGLTVKTPPPDANAEVAAEPAAPASVEPETEADDGTVVAAAPGKPGPEFRIEEFAVRGIDFRFSDRTGEIPTELPLTGLDLEVRGLSNRVGPEARPMRFDLFLEGGEVELPERSVASSLLAGMVTATGRALVGAEDEAGTAMRPLVEELAVQGQIQLQQPPVGRVRASILGLQLGALRGLVEGSGVTIGDGVFDLGADVRMLGPRGIDGDATLTFAHLDLSEPAGGPISRYLKLPAPLGPVLYVLQNERGEQVIPLDFHVDAEGGVSAAKVAGTAVTALGTVIADAVASSPLRVAAGVTDLIGLTGGAEADPSEDAESVAFGPGVVALDAAARAQVQQVARILVGDEDLVVVLQHAFGGGDWRQAEKLANPDPETARALANRMRQRRAELIRSRDEFAATARAHYAVGRDVLAAEASRRLRALDRELARVEESLDAVLQLARPNADRRRDRRTLEAALDIGNARLAAVRRALTEAGVPNPDQRIDARRPRPNRPEDDAGGAVVLVPQRRQTQ